MWLGAPVRVGADEVGRVTAAVADPALERLLGLELTGSRGRLFLPWIAATVLEGVLYASSPLVLFDADEVDGYVRRGARLVTDPAEISRLTASATQASVSADVAAGTPCT